MKLPRIVLQAIGSNEPPDYSLAGPLQLAFHGDPWRVAVTSMLLCRTRRKQVDRVLPSLLRVYPLPNAMARADDLEERLRPLGLQRSRARQLQRMSVKWNGLMWEDLRDLPGCGVYVADAVALFCFGCRSIVGSDAVLLKYAEQPQHSVLFVDGAWKLYDDTGNVVRISTNAVSLVLQKRQIERSTSNALSTSS